MESITRSMNNMNMDTDIDELTQNMNNCTLKPRPKKIFKPKVKNGNPYNRPPTKGQSMEIILTQEQKNIIKCLKGLQ